MSRFGFAHCLDCGRLNIRGARCVCDPIPELPCDCHRSGNTEHTGPTCAARERDEWGRVIRVSRQIAQKIRNDQETT